MFNKDPDMEEFLREEISKACAIATIAMEDGKELWPDPQERRRQRLIANAHYGGVQKEIFRRKLMVILSNSKFSEWYGELRPQMHEKARLEACRRDDTGVKGEGRGPVWYLGIDSISDDIV